ncbi:MAG TPA: energy transducer TonB [Longimicrobiales bacterium]
MAVERRVLMRLACAAACVLVQACGDGTEPVREPVPLPDPTPIAYPEGLWDRGVQGETEVLVHVNEMGDVDSVLVSKSSGYSDFDSAAVNGARRLRFTPGQRGDRRIAMWTKIPIRFARDSTWLGTSTGSGITPQ